MSGLVNCEVTIVSNMFLKNEVSPDKMMADYEATEMVTYLLKHYPNAPAEALLMYYEDNSIGYTLYWSTKALLGGLGKC